MQSFPDVSGRGDSRQAFSHGAFLFRWIARFTIIAAIVGAFFQFGDILGIGKSKSHVFSELINRTLAQQYAKASDVRENILVVEIDRPFVTQRAGVIGIERDWPLPYRDYAQLLRRLQNEIDPSAVLLDIVFRSVRGQGDCPGPDCDPEDFDLFLSQLCAMGQAPCDSEPAPRCTTLDRHPQATTVVLALSHEMQGKPLVVPEDVNGASALQAYYDLVQSCAHLTFADVGFDPHFSHLSNYAMTATDAAHDIRASAGREIAMGACRDEKSPIPLEDCTKLSRVLDSMSAATSDIGLIWGPGRWPNAEAPTETSQEVALTWAPCIASEPQRNTDGFEYAPCDYLPSITMSQLENVMNLRPTQRDQIFSKLDGGIVLIGPDRISGEDPFITPVNRTVTSGVFYHATAVENILRYGADIKSTSPRISGNVVEPIFVFMLVQTILLSIAVFLFAKFLRPTKWEEESLLGDFYNLLRITMFSVVATISAGIIFFFVFNWSLNEWAGTTFITAFAVRLIKYGILFPKPSQ